MHDSVKKARFSIQCSPQLIYQVLELHEHRKHTFSFPICHASIVLILLTHLRTADLLEHVFVALLWTGAGDGTPAL